VYVFSAATSSLFITSFHIISVFIFHCTYIEILSSSVFSICTFGFALMWIINEQLSEEKVWMPKKIQMGV
jgi:archaellum biogenesis protein FlaJ (TadC family)